MYYKKAYGFIDKIKVLLWGFSPSFMLYKSMKDKVVINCNEKEYKSNVSNLMKALYFSLTACILVLFSIFDFKNRFYQKGGWTSYSNIAFLIITFIIPLITCFISVYYKNIYLNKIQQYISKLVYRILKNIEVLYVISLIISILMCFYTELHFNIGEEIILGVLAYYYGVSRPIHFFLVFVPDLIKKIETGAKRDNQGRVRLINITVLSYINMVLDYVVLYYVLNIFAYKYFNEVNVFSNSIKNIVDMLYYTVGCDTLLANNFIMKFYRIIFKASVTMLITGNLAEYISMKESN